MKIKGEDEWMMFYDDKHGKMEKRKETKIS